MLNTAEKLLRYSDASLQIVGVFHQTAVDKMTTLLTRIGVRRGFIVQGMDGSEDLPVHRRARVAVVEDGKSESHILDPAAYGLTPEENPPEDWHVETQATMIMEVLQGKASSACRNMAVWNSGIRLWFAGKAPSIQEGIELSTQLLEEGLALKRFQQWKETVQGTPLQAAPKGST